MSTDETPFQHQTHDQLPDQPRGPHAPSLVLGLATLLVVVLVAVGLLTDVSIDTGAVLAVSLVVLGGLLVVGGALSGLRSRSGR